MVPLGAWRFNTKINLGYPLTLTLSPWPEILMVNELATGRPGGARESFVFLNVFMGKKNPLSPLWERDRVRGKRCIEKKSI